VVYERAIEELPVAGLRAVWSPDLGYASVDPEVLGIAERAAEALLGAAGLRRSGRKVALTEPVRAWLGTGAIDIWLHLEPDDWPARGELLGSFVRGSYASTEAFAAPRYAGVLRRRTRLEYEVAELFREVDVVLTPTTAVPAFAAEGPGREVEIAGRRVDPALTVPFTMIANLCWNPAISVPAGLPAAGLPVGLQILCRRHADDVVLRLARLFEQARPWPLRPPGMA
jgi:aspartyl-tRNA(Asn)/glutamyl-tRNA(Gln) amidotransferase subunit A